MRVGLLLLALLQAGPGSAQAVIATQTIRAREVISADKLDIAAIEAKGAVQDPGQIIGMEARVALHAGRRIFARDVTPAALIDRNDVVQIVFIKGGLRIEMEGRALERGVVGDALRVMNPASRTTVTGQVMPDGKIEVK